MRGGIIPALVVIVMAVLVFMWLQKRKQ